MNEAISYTQIPEGWEVIRLKDITRRIASGVTPKGGSETYPENGIPFLRSQNVHNHGLKLEGVKFISEKTNEAMKNSSVKPNDILLNITGASIGRSCVVPSSLKRANINQHILRIRIIKDYVPFISKSLTSSITFEFIIRVQTGSSKEGLTMGQALRIPIALPPQPEQNQITQYLDEKTAAINRKIELLEQKADKYRNLLRSLINETVCLGLDKSVKLKYSGIEWIGEVPEHWAILRMKDLFTIKKRLVGKNASLYKLLSLTQKGVIPRDLESGKGKFPAKFDSYQIVRGGDLIFCLFDMDVTPRTVGYSRESGMITGAYTVLNSHKDISMRYYHYLYLTVDDHKNLKCFYSGLRNTIKKETFLSLPVPLPPKDEQNSIVEYLDEKYEKVHSILSNISEQIDKLKELRKSIINEVVTGQRRISTSE